MKILDYKNKKFSSKIKNYYNYSIVKKSWTYLTGAIRVILYTFMFASLKLIPAMAYLRSHPRFTFEIEHIPFEAFYDIFLNSSQVHYHKAFSEQPWGWHAYTCYIGITLFLLLIVAITILSISKLERTNCIILLFISTFFFSLYIGDTGSLSIYRLIRDLPVFNQMHVTGRYVIILMFIASLLVGMFLKIVERSRILKFFLNSKLLHVWTILSFFIFAFIFYDHVSVSRHFFYHAFRIDPKNVQNAVLEYRSEKYKQLQRIKGRKLYPTVLSNIGIIDCFPEPLKNVTGSQPETDLITASNQSSKITKIIFTPNKITFDLETEGTSIYLNQTYIKGWKVSKADITVENIENRVAAKFPAGKYQKLAFYFLPNSFLLGCFVFIGFIFFLIIRQYLIKLKEQNNN